MFSSCTAMKKRDVLQMLCCRTILMRNILEMPFFVCLVAWLVVWQDHPVDDMQQNHRCVATLSFGVVKNINDELIFVQGMFRLSYQSMSFKPNSVFLYIGGSRGVCVDFTAFQACLLRLGSKKEHEVCNLLWYQVLPSMGGQPTMKSMKYKKNKKSLQQSSKHCIIMKELVSFSITVSPIRRMEKLSWSRPKDRAFDRRGGRSKPQ